MNQASLAKSPKCKQSKLSRSIILPFASNRDRQTLKRVCLRLKRHVGRVKHANYNVETKRFDRDMRHI